MQLRLKMEGIKKTIIIYSGIFGILFMSIGMLILFIKKFKKKSLYPIQTIAWKKLPWFKSIPLKVQLQSTKKQRSSEEESVSSIDSEFSIIKERRDDMIDPLLGVLHTSQQRKARLSETKEPQYRKIAKTNRLTLQPEKKIRKIEKKIISEVGKNTIILETALVWASNDNSLTIMMPSIDPLLFKNNKTHLTIKIESVHKVDKNVLKFEDKKECQSKNGLIFCFKGMTLEEAQSCYIRLEASERKHRLSKEHITSRGVLSLKKCVLVPNTPLNLFTQLTVLKDRSGSSQEHIFGTLWISLKCSFVGQVSANFILEVKRAENLPALKSGGGYRTEVFLVRKEKKIQYFCTNSKHGNSPEWNSSFQFDVSINNISDYSLEFVILKMGKIGGSRRIGKSSLIDGGIKSQSSFWEDIIENIGEEVLYKRELKNPLNEDQLPLIEDKLLGQLSLTLSESTNLNLSTREFCITPNCLSSFEYDKSGGEYKLEIVVQEKKRNLLQYTTTSSQSDSLQWNSPQHFKVRNDQISNINLTITLIRQGRLKKSTKLGRILIGSDAFSEWREEALNAPSTQWFPMYKL